MVTFGRSWSHPSSPLLQPSKKLKIRVEILLTDIKSWETDTKNKHVREPGGAEGDSSPGQRWSEFLCRIVFHVVCTLLAGWVLLFAIDLESPWQATLSLSTIEAVWKVALCHKQQSHGQPKHQPPLSAKIRLSWQTGRHFVETWMKTSKWRPRLCHVDFSSVSLEVVLYIHPVCYQSSDQVFSTAQLHRRASAGERTRDSRSQWWRYVTHCRKKRLAWEYWTLLVCLFRCQVKQWCNRVRQSLCGGASVPRCS